MSSNQHFDMYFDRRRDMGDECSSNGGTEREAAKRASTCTTNEKKSHPSSKSNSLFHKLTSIINTANVSRKSNGKKSNFIHSTFATKSKSKSINNSEATKTTLSVDSSLSSSTEDSSYSYEAEEEDEEPNFSRQKFSISSNDTITSSSGAQPRLNKTSAVDFLNYYSYSSSTSSLISPVRKKPSLPHVHTDNQTDLSSDNDDMMNEFETRFHSKSPVTLMDRSAFFLTSKACILSNSWSSNVDDYAEDDFMDAFRIFDTDGDGRITAKELTSVLAELGIKTTKADIKKMINELDRDKNGTIEYSEFVQMMTMPASKQDDEFELREAFKCIDLDGNGFISRDELSKAVRKIMSTDGKFSLADVEEMMNEADTDGNGLIDYDEFVRVLVEKRN